jgi:sulfate transport system substrate-binding protein
VDKNWRAALPRGTAPYSSTVVFLVRHGNPKHVTGWDDLIRGDVKVITPNPKTSGGARWNHLAAYGHALRTYGNDETKAEDFLRKLYANVPVLDTGAAGAAASFTERGLGDVLLTWESEAFLVVNKSGKDTYDVLYPPLDVRADPSAAVTRLAEKAGHGAVAKAYLEGLYTPEAQEIIARNGFRPADPKIAAKHADRFPPASKKLTFLTIDDFGGAAAVQKKHFDSGGVFDRVSGK